ncbi:MULTISPECIES: hypothetical protein [Vagococcus]|uniref:Uncharacterized protein n=1 Tax=Vagococcus fluvialis bH819 TaxID=1255619 RepID=A0A1X6WR75_9ENTE|nr:MULTISPECIES: hypothetical protein [Vagococcus]SLM86790.1 hypothetical protein FM121_11885 [Vagococcus fluvialis bH819]HCM88751.1 hypothetical protein [Vagococcus sp.]
MKNNEDILLKVTKIVKYHKSGLLGGELMPEDDNPGYSVNSKENYLYFTLPMALNYQRSAYALWKSAYITAIDNDTSDVFMPEKVLLMSDYELQEKLVKHKVALQKNKQTLIWRTLCETLVELFDGDVKELFRINNNSILETKKYMLSKKKKFPYLSGNKIMNYWLYIMTLYTDIKFSDRENITVAPDTNVIQASLKLGVIDEEEYKKAKVQQLVSVRWEEILLESCYDPIDIHTPLWLWKRSGFKYFDKL